MGAAENKLTKEILSLFEPLSWIKVWRQNNHRTPGRAFIGLKGVPDIIGHERPHGTMWGIEVKEPGGNGQSEFQKDFQADLEKDGGVYILAYELEDVIKVLKQKGKIK